MSEVEPIYIKDFERIRQIIEQAGREATYKVNETVINVYWNIGKFVSQKTEQDGWGRSTVKQLSKYILAKTPGIHGYSAQNIWRMKQFFETYQNKPELSSLLRANTWSNNLHIMSKTKSDEEKLFYLKLASKEKYKARELERQIDSGYYERLLLSDGKAPSAVDPSEATGMIRDLCFFSNLAGTLSLWGRNIIYMLGKMIISLIFSFSTGNYGVSSPLI